MTQGISIRAVAGPLYDSWGEFDHVIDGVSAPDSARTQFGSSIAWTVGHCANQVDSLVNVRLAGLAPHSLIGEHRFRVGGDGRAEDWDAIRSAALEVREAARAFLDGLSAEEWERRVPYEGSMLFLREVGISPAYAAARVAVHHYFHAGEIAHVRSMMGQAAGDYPGEMRWTLGT